VMMEVDYTEMRCKGAAAVNLYQHAKGLPSVRIVRAAAVK